ncbi:MAG: acyl-CoA thioesterase [bacterium]|nr:acyl-CoA thioesterase [bacterium]
MAKLSYNPDLFYHWHTIKTRFRDLDPLNHVNNAVFNSYFEEARIHFVESVPELANSFERGASFVLVKSTIEYMKPILYPQTLLIGTGCLSVGNSSVEAYQAIFDQDSLNLHAIATTTGVWFDLKKQRPTRVPEVANLDEMMVNLDG